MKVGTGPAMKGLMVALVARVVLAPVRMLRGLIEVHGCGRKPSRAWPAGGAGSNSWVDRFWQSR